MSRFEGEIVTITRTEEIIARFPISVSVGTEVIDNRNKPVGVIKNIFGPVDDPYYEIESVMKRDKRLSITGKKLYVEEDN